VNVLAVEYPGYSIYDQTNNELTGKSNNKA